MFTYIDMAFNLCSIPICSSLRFPSYLSDGDDEMSLEMWEITWGAWSQLFQLHNPTTFLWRIISTHQMSFPLASVRQGSEPFSGKPFCQWVHTHHIQVTPRYRERVPIFWWSPSHIGLWRPYHLMKHSNKLNSKWIAHFLVCFLITEGPILMLMMEGL